MSFVTEKEFMSLPVTKDHMELIDGEIVLSPPPTTSHQHLVGELHFLLKVWAAANPPSWVGLSPLDVRLGPDRIVQPDLCLLLSGMPSGKGPIHVIPDLVIEVLSQNRSYDRVTKKLLYAEAGVREYWIADEVTRSIEVIRGLKSAKASKTTVVSTVAKGFEVEVKKLFAR